MGSFSHTPDNKIIINGTLSMPLSFFQTQEAKYALDPAYTSQYYEQKSHWVLSDGSNATAGTIPWADGDGYISNIATYQAAYELLTDPPPTLSQAKATKIAEMIDFAYTVKIGGVTVTAVTYDSSDSTLTKLMRENDKYTRAGALPLTYYVNDVDYVQVTIGALADLRVIIDRIIELYYLTDVNIDVHRAAINALGTVELVDAYDFSSGWQTTPY